MLDPSPSFKKNLPSHFEVRLLIGSALYAGGYIFVKKQMISDDLKVLSEPQLFTVFMILTS
jgi:hypothetical protein